MIPLGHAITQLGSSSLRFLWLPLAIWTLLAGVIWLFLKWRKNFHPLYQYHLRVGLLTALPAGIFLWIVIGRLMQWLSYDTAKDGHLIMISSPVILSNNFVSIAPQPIWAQTDFWIGLCFCIIFMIAIFQIIRFSIHLWYLHTFRCSLEIIPLTDISLISDSNRKIVSRLERTVFAAITSDSDIPATFGSKKPVILVPDYLLNNEGQLNVAIRHELVHISRKDYAVQLLILFISYLFFFHPVMHLLVREITEYNEISCDREVLSLSGISVKHYASMLYELLSKRPVIHPSAVSMAHTKSNIKMRIQAMETSSRNSKSLKTSFSISAPLMLVLALLMASSDIQNGPLPLHKISASDNSVNMVMPQTVNTNSNTGRKKETRTLPIDRMPQMVGGRAYIQKRIIYPELAKKEGIQGKVLVQFTVTREGNVVNARIVQGIGGGCDREILNLIRKAKFRPATNKGRAVEAKVSMPFIFRIIESGQSTVEPLQKKNPNAFIIVAYGQKKNISFKKAFSASKTVDFNNHFRSAKIDTSKNGNKIFVVVEKMPQLIGGLSSLQAKLKYPEPAHKAGIEGTVYVQFVVNEKGNVTDASVVRGIGGGCDREALKIVKSAKFKPGIQHGKPVKVRYALPIIFKLHPSK